MIAFPVVQLLCEASFWTIAGVEINWTATETINRYEFNSIEGYLACVNNGHPTAPESDYCLAMLLTSCTVADFCKFTMRLDNTTFGYQLTHK